MTTRKARSQQPENVRRAARRRDADQKRAEWIVNEWRNRPSLTPGELQHEVRVRFACGIVASKRAHGRALQIRAAQFEALDLSWFVDKYNDLYERALADGNINAARKIMDSMAVNTGIAKPRRIVAAVAVGQVTPEQLAHVSVLALTPAQRENRLRELEAKAGEDLAPPMLDVDGVEAPPADATDADVG